jgi:predicted enzyme related to lactoylglutathione lyase
MSRVVHFEIHADDPERAARFYTGLLGWEFTKWGGGQWDYWLIKTGEPGEAGIDGGMVRRPGAVDGNSVLAYVCTINIDDIDATVGKALTLGAKTALPKQAVPGVGWLAYLKDPEQNIFGVMQNDPAAR